MQNQKWTFVFLLWVSEYRFGTDRWKHRHHSHRNKIHYLPNRNVLAVNLPHKQAFEGRRGRAYTHTHLRGYHWAKPSPHLSECCAAGECGGGTIGAMHNQVFRKGWEKPGKKGVQNHLGGGVWERNKRLNPTTWFTLETTDFITDHSADYRRC